jgi:hypothetical protein
MNCISAFGSSCYLFTKICCADLNARGAKVSQRLQARIKNKNQTPIGYCFFGIWFFCIGIYEI